MKKIFLTSFILFFSCFSKSASAASLDYVDKGVCTMEMDPVCAEIQVQCIKAPCKTITRTFNNMCEMRKNKLAKFLHKGMCELEEIEPTPIQTPVSITDSCLLSDNASRRVCSSNLMKQEDKNMIEDFVKNNISKISNDFGIHEVLGGKFYITNMHWVYEDNLNLLQVEYEDGHVSYIANLFAFTNVLEKTKDNPYGIKVDLFYLVKDNGKEVDKKNDDKNIIEEYIKNNITQIAKNYGIESSYGKQLHAIGEINWINDNNLRLEFGDGYNSYIANIVVHLEPADIVKIDNFKIQEQQIITQNIRTNLVSMPVNTTSNIFVRIKNFFKNIFKPTIKK